MSGYDRFCKMQDEYRYMIRRLCNNLLKHECIKRSYAFDKGLAGSRWRLEELRYEFKSRGLI